MVYINENGQIGNLKVLLKHVSNPQFLSEEELLGFGITKYVEPAKPVLTLEEVKLNKIDSSGKECYKYVTDRYPEYKQLSALHGGIYSEEENQEIKDFCAARVIGFRAWKEHIQTLTTIEEVEECNWITRELDEDTMAIISETFWGE